MFYIVPDVPVHNGDFHMRKLLFLLVAAALITPAFARRPPNPLPLPPRAPAPPQAAIPLPPPLNHQAGEEDNQEGEEDHQKTSTKATLPLRPRCPGPDRPGHHSSNTTTTTTETAKPVKKPKKIRRRRRHHHDLLFHHHQARYHPLIVSQSSNPVSDRIFFVCANEKAIDLNF